MNHRGPEILRLERSASKVLMGDNTWKWGRSHATYWPWDYMWMITGLIPSSPNQRGQILCAWMSQESPRKPRPRTSLLRTLTWKVLQIMTNQSSVDLQHHTWRNNSFMQFADRKTWCYVVMMQPGDRNKRNINHYITTTRSKDAIWEEEVWE